MARSKMEVLTPRPPITRLVPCPPSQLVAAVRSSGGGRGWSCTGLHPWSVIVGSLSICCRIALAGSERGCHLLLVLV